MSINTSSTGSGLTLAAMGATLLFALTTIAAGIWGGMQYQALQASRAECAALEQRVATLKGDLDQMAALPPPMPPVAPPPPPQMPPPPPAPGMGMIPPAQGLPGMPPPPPADGAGQENLMGAAIKMFEGEQGDAMIRAATGMQMGLMYGDFLDQYGLTPEKRAQVEEILRAHMAEQMRVGMGAMAGASGQAIQDSATALEQSLRDQLSQVLSPRELNDWDQYEATREERMVAKGLEMQLNMMAGSMSSEGRDLARDVLAEETIAAMHRTQGAVSTASDPARAMTQGIAAQSEAVRIARDRLTNALSPGDMQAFDRFAESMRAQQEMMGGLMGGPPQPQR